MIFDKSGNSNTDQVWLEVIDETLPAFSSQPDNITYEMGSTGHAIAWTIDDNHKDTFVISKNNTIIQSGNYSSDIEVSINVDGFSVTTYNYTIVVNDTTGLQTGGYSGHARGNRIPQTYL